MPELRQAIADKFAADNSLEYRPSQVIVSNGAKHSCYNAILATCEPGDEVIIPSPYWVSYPDMVRLAGAEPVIVPTNERNGWKMTAAEFENAMTPRTKMVIMNSPGNPSGSVYSARGIGSDRRGRGRGRHLHFVGRDLRKAGLRRRETRQHRVALETGLRSDDHGQRLQQILRDDGLAARLHGRAGSDRQGGRFDPESQHLESLLIRAKGAVAALKGDQQPLSDMHDEFDMRRNYMFDRISKIANITAVKPQGAFYVLVNISQLGLNSQNFSDRLLSKANVAVVPGAAFGDDRTIRLSYATSIDVIKKGLDRFQDFCRTL